MIYLLSASASSPIILNLLSDDGTLTWMIYLLSASASSPIILNLLTFFSLWILKVPWDSLVSISRLWISMSLFLTWYSSSNFSPNTALLVELLAEDGEVILAHA